LATEPHQKNNKKMIPCWTPVRFVSALCCMTISRASTTSLTQLCSKLLLLQLMTNTTSFDAHATYLLFFYVN